MPPDWQSHWHREDEVNLPAGVVYLVMLDKNGVRWSAPLGSPYPDDAVVEQVESA